MLANVHCLPSSFTIIGDCAKLRLQRLFSRCRSQNYLIQASKSKKKFSTKKRVVEKAKPAQVGQPSETKEAVPVPPRIDSNSNIPVRLQQKFVQRKKEAEAAAKKVPYKQTFRKVKLDPEQRAEEAKREAEYEKAARAAANKSPLASLRNLYGESGKEHPPVVLVDGYNLLHKFVGIMQLNLSNHPIATAESFEDQRIALQNSMVTYSQRRGIKVVIAYDAINRVADPVYLDIRTSSRSTIPGGVELVFCSDQSADTWIVREVDVLQAEGKVPQILVTTDDNEVASSCNIRNVWPLPCRDLVKEILDAEADIDEIVRGSKLFSSTVRSRYGVYRHRQFDNGTGNRTQLGANQALQALRDEQVQNEQLQKMTNQHRQSQAAPEGPA